MAEKLLTVRQVQTASEGDHSDGAGLMLRGRGASASWLLRCTAPSGRRREMGLGICRRGNPKETGESLSGARQAAGKARTELISGLDPIGNVASPRSRELTNVRSSPASAASASCDNPTWICSKRRFRAKTARRVSGLRGFVATRGIRQRMQISCL